MIQSWLSTHKDLTFWWGKWKSQKYTQIIEVMKIKGEEGGRESEIRMDVGDSTWDLDAKG
jgi:hypothetical protein